MESVLLKMPIRLCVSGCRWCLSASDGHDCCLLCLGSSHAWSLFHCENMTKVTLWSRLSFLVREGVTSAAPHASPSGIRIDAGTAFSATKVVAQALSQTMSKLRVQEKLKSCRDEGGWQSALSRFILQVGLFGNTIEDIDKQFSTATEEDLSN